jgi:hypothetical protein
MQRSDSINCKPLLTSSEHPDSVDIDEDMVKIFVDQNQNPLDLPKNSIARVDSPHTLALIIESEQMHNDGTKFNLVASSRPSRNLHCCRLFKTRLKCLLIVLPIIAILAGIVGFVLFPRLPNIDVGAPFAEDSKKGFQYNSTRDGKLTAISYDLAINFSVSSINYWDFYTSSILVKVIMINSLC